MEVLLIVDLQAAFSAPPELVEKIRRYSRRFKRRAFVRFVNPPGSLFRRKLMITHCSPGSPDNVLLLDPQKQDLVIDKVGYGLHARDIARLRKLGMKKAVVCGLETDACVLGIMFSLFDAGVDCRINKALCWSSTGLHQQALDIIETQFSPPRKKSR